jgi:hypothetical protein
MFEAPEWRLFESKLPSKSAFTVDITVKVPIFLPSRHLFVMFVR